MSLVFRLIIVSFLGLGTTICSAQSYFEKGLDYYNNRAEKHEELKVDSTNINQAIFYFEKELHEDKNAESVTEFLLKSYYYKAAFVVRSKDEQKLFYKKGTELGEKSITTYPKNKGILLWYIANFSKYGEANGIISSVKEGLADKIKRHTEQLLELDASFESGAAHKILGVINYKVPNIPFMITWPSKEKAEEHLKKALAVNPKSISNIYYYAEFLSEVKRKEEAKILLQKVMNTSPRKEALIEDLYDISMAKKLIDKLEN
ncbi:MAG: hypothetical protein H6586_06065 [Flavobacteriales bacterium]|nr:hypothetical protein [Flavobacteriales bacterium]